MSPLFPRLLTVTGIALALAACTTINMPPDTAAAGAPVVDASVHQDGSSAAATTYPVGSATAQPMAALAEGRFPKELADVFMKQGDGLFPAPKEISFSCTCPDQYGKHMCKHIAAALYGIGNRLDSAPLMLFTLRGIAPEVLIKKSVEEKMKTLLANAGKPSGRVIADADIERLFGV